MHNWFMHYINAEQNTYQYVENVFFFEEDTFAMFELIESIRFPRYIWT